MVSSDRRAEQLFHAAAELPPAERGPYLDRACHDDHALREEVESLLVAMDGAGSFLEKPAQETFDALETSLDGKRIGRYRIVRRIAIGGMSSVFEAEQDEPHRTVALKLMHQGKLGSRTLERFRMEAEVLGRLRHPAVAQVLEAGVGDSRVEVPWIAMEFVPDARDIIDYIRSEAPSQSERIQLFLSVCDAVHHGHQKGVIHRDLKPSNILVDREGRPKVIDFGVARLIDQDHHQMLTDHGELVGTLQYMSPEQCAGDPARVDLRTDVHALGLVLYEGLCGRRPYEVAGLPLTEAVRTVSHQEPLRPTRANPDLPADIEAVLRKALDKDPERRYASVNALAEDLRRFLRHESVVARPAGPIHSMRLFARRRPVVTLGVVFLVVSAAVSTGFAIDARRAQAAAEAESNGRKQMLEFVIQLFERADPDVAQGYDPPLSEILAGAIDDIEQRLPEMPYAQATILHRFALVMQNRGKTPESLPLLDRIFEIEQRHGLQADVFAACRQLRGRALRDHGRLDEAAAELESAIAAFERLGGTTSSGSIDCRIDLSSIRAAQGRFDDAEQLLTDVLATGSREITVGLALSNLGQLSLRRKDYPRAERLLSAALNHLTEEDGRPTIRQLTTQNTLALVLKYQGKLQQALPLYQSARNAYRLLVPDDDRSLATFEINLGALLRELGRFDEAESYLKSSLARSLHFDGHEATLESQNQLLLIALTKEDWPTAERLGREVSGLQRARGYPSRSIGVTLRRTARAVERDQRVDEACALLTEAIAEFEKDPVASPLVATLRDLATLRRSTGDYEGADDADARADAAEKNAVIEPGDESD